MEPLLETENADPLMLTLAHCVAVPASAHKILTPWLLGPAKTIWEYILLELILLLFLQAVTLLRLANSILPILSDFFLMKLNNSFICYVISFPSGSSKTNSVES